MADVNRVLLTGRLTRDPKVWASQDGQSWTLAFGLAVGERAHDQATGQWVDRANFVNCCLYGPRAQSLGQILRKGMPVTVEGRLRWSQYERDGQTRSGLDVVVSELVLPPREPQAPAQTGDAAYDGGPCPQGAWS